MQKSRLNSADAHSVSHSIYRPMSRLAKPLAYSAASTAITTAPIAKFAKLASLVGAFLLCSTLVQAMTITGVDGASRPVDLTITPAVIYGGVAGDAGSGSGSAPYNSCDTSTTPYAPCNPARVTSTTVLRIRVNTTATTTGVPRLFYTGGSTATSSAMITPDSSSPSSAGAGDTYVAVTWGSICAAFGAASLNGLCVHLPGNAAVYGTFRIGYVTSTSDQNLPTSDVVDFKIVVNGNMGELSAPVGSAAGAATTESFMSDCQEGTYNQYGICSWVMTAGDEKATMTEPRTDQGLNGPSLQFAAVRVFYVPADYATADASTYAKITNKSPSQDLALSTDASGGLALGGSGRITGLKNDQTYAFKIAMVDLAGNIGLYTPPYTSATALGDDYCPEADRTSKCHLATPGEVVGVLSKNLNCFVATAAFGSQMAPEVETFRKFRNQFLLTNKWGTEFVRFYYRHSPKYAAIIAHSETFRSIARLCLWPLLGYAWLALHIGAKYAFALLGLFLGSIFLIGYRVVMSPDDEDGPQGSQRA